MTDDVVTTLGMPDTQLTPESQTPDAEPALPPNGMVRSIADLEPGMQLEGRVKSITEFGAFIDLGVGPQGLVHISQMSRRRVNQVSDVVHVGDAVQVWVKKVDKKRGRISLTMVRPATVRLKDLEPNTVVAGTVTRIEPYGVFLDIGTGRDGMVHISELAEGYVSSPSDVLSVGDRIEARVINIDRKARKVDLSTKEFIRVSTPEPEPEPEPEPVAVAEQPNANEKPAPTIMELAFQAALQRRGNDRAQRGIQKLIARRLKR